MALSSCSRRRKEGQRALHLRWTLMAPSCPTRIRVRGSDVGDPWNLSKSPIDFGIISSRQIDLAGYVDTIKKR